MFFKTIAGRVVLVLIALAVIALIGFAVYSSNKSTVAPGGVYGGGNVQTDPNQTKEQADALVRQAIDNRDSALCAKIYSETEKNYCLDMVLSTKASDAKDPKLCASISIPDYKTGCLDNIVFNEARAAKDPSLCSKLIDQARLNDCKAVAK